MWVGAVGLVVIGTAFVFLAVTMSGLFLPGVVLIDAGLLVAAGAGVMSLRAAGSAE